MQNFSIGAAEAVPFAPFSSGSRHLILNITFGWPISCAYFAVNCRNASGFIRHIDCLDRKAAMHINVTINNAIKYDTTSLCPIIFQFVPALKIWRRFDVLSTSVHRLTTLRMSSFRTWPKQLPTARQWLLQVSDCFWWPFLSIGADRGGDKDGNVCPLSGNVKA